ncbi:MAG: hypothetical protein ACXAAR_08495 [Candidatus Thorarchaeota archaeon]
MMNEDDMIVLFKRIEMKGGPLLKALRKFEPCTPDMKDGDILVTCPAYSEN